MAMALIASTRGVALLPEYAKNFLHNKTNTSPIVRLFLSRLDQLENIP
jgi:LysR family hca operon transcriptional activator